MTLDLNFHFFSKKCGSVGGSDRPEGSIDLIEGGASCSEARFSDLFGLNHPPQDRARTSSPEPVPDQLVGTAEGERRRLGLRDDSRRMNFVNFASGSSADFRTSKLLSSALPRASSGT
ncbi:MAG: hypothetical protein HYV07_11370 [Deltaproteobacteria bacterium]|nr:hypothetical protein [Deltaproteobacteria bacterium]